MVAMNVFRILADVSHTVSKVILIWAIHANSSAEGVSLITQGLYTVVFCSRYLDLFWSHPFDEDTHPVLSIWNFFLKIFYIVSSIYILFIMTKVYGRTHERDRAWRFGAACLGGSLVLAPFTMLALSPRSFWGFPEFLWVFSIILESVCVLPQLILLRQTTIPTVIDSFYLLTLGSYRGFYILNWIVRGANHDPPNTTAVIFGVIQTAFYVDFAWVYWTRQRVKLRGGALIDSDDLKRGWLVNRLMGRGDISAAHQSNQAAEEGESDPNAARRSEPTQWGPRGISVSADDDVPHPSSKQKDGPPRPKSDEPSKNLRETRAILHSSDEDSDSDVDGIPPAKDSTSSGPRGVGNGSEWRSS